MKIAISGILLNVSFPELTTHTDSTRVVQCILKTEDTKQIFTQEVAVCLEKNFKKTDYEKAALRKVLNSYYPYPTISSGEKNLSTIQWKAKNALKASRREIWHDYLVSSAKRRKLIPQSLVEEITSKHTTPQTH